MDYKHDDEFGQASSREQKNSSQRDGTRQSPQARRPKGTETGNRPFDQNTTGKSSAAGRDLERGRMNVSERGSKGGRSSVARRGPEGERMAAPKRSQQGDRAGTVGRSSESGRTAAIRESDLMGNSGSGPENGFEKTVSRGRGPEAGRSEGFMRGSAGKKTGVSIRDQDGGFERGSGIQAGLGRDRVSAVRESAAGYEQASGSVKKLKVAKETGENPREMVAQAKIQRAKQRKRRRRLITMIVAECFALAAIFTYAYFARRLTLVQREEFDTKTVRNDDLSVEDITKMKGYWMIAVFGVDSRDNNVGAGVQSDVNIICCINQDTGDIKLVSLYRDTYLNVNDSNSYRKFNAAYTNGGPQQALKALNKNLDLDIVDYITFSWKAVAQGINILGGVDVEITPSEFRFINGFITETVKATDIGSHHLTKAGMQHLDGVQAVAYGRLRLMDTDFARTERQRKIIELAFAKAKQADYATLNNILVTVLPSVMTNLSFEDLTNMILSINKYHIGETAGFPFAKGNVTIPGKGDCVIPQTLESNVSQLHTFLFGDEAYTPTDRVKQISSKIAADSGMYKEGKPSSNTVSTQTPVPKETSSSSKETTSSSRETEESAKENESSETRETKETKESEETKTDEERDPLETIEAMTDENGNVIDGPIEDWPEEEDPRNPGEQYGPGVYNPSYPQSSSAPISPGSESSESSEGRNPGGTRPGSGQNIEESSQSGEIVGPGGSLPGSTVPGGGTTGTTTPGGTETRGNTPGSGTSSGTGSGAAGATSPGGTGSGGNTPGSGTSSGTGNGAAGAASPGGTGSGGNTPGSGTSSGSGSGAAGATSPGGTGTSGGTGNGTTGTTAPVGMSGPLQQGETETRGSIQGITAPQGSVSGGNTSVSVPSEENRDFGPGGGNTGQPG